MTTAACHSFLHVNLFAKSMLRQTEEKTASSTKAENTVMNAAVVDATRRVRSKPGGIQEGTMFTQGPSFCATSSSNPRKQELGSLLSSSSQTDTREEASYRTFQSKPIELSCSTCSAVIDDGLPSTSRVCCSRCTTTHCPNL